MTGFFKRDYYFIKLNLLFYVLFIAAFAILVTFTDANSSFLSLYVVIFGISSVTGLFSYDDFNHWTAYGVAVPGGRRDMVNARYLLVLVMGVGIAAVQLLLSLLGREESILPMTALQGGAFLLYAAVTLPVSYYFGGTKARMVMILIVAGSAAVIGMGGAMVNITRGFGMHALPPALLFLPLLGLLALALSWRISLGIMGKKEC